LPLAYCWNEDLHLATTLDGKLIPTVTQVLELARLSPSFKTMVKRGVILQETLDRRCTIGKDVHDLTDFDDQEGYVPDTWLTEETAGYVESWRGFKRLTGFKPTAWSIRRCELINGLSLTGESDAEGFIGKHPAIIDKKTGSVASDSWGLQTSGYEMLRYRSPKIGRVIRAVAWLQKDGSPGKLIEYGETSPIDGIHYGDAFLAALHCVHAGIRRGYISELDVMD
jgi:hypothetical protein